MRWSLLDWQADVHGTGGLPADRRARRPAAAAAEAPPPSNGNPARRGRSSTRGGARFHLRTAGRFPLDSVLAGGAESGGRRADAIHASRMKAVSFTSRSMRRLEVEEAGALRAAVLVEGDLARPGGEPLLRFIARLHFFAGSAAVRFVLTLRNPRKAEHPGGLWDLGNGGSVYLRDASLMFALPPGEGPSSIRCSPEVGAPLAPAGVPLGTVPRLQRRREVAEPQPPQPQPRRPSHVPRLPAAAGRGRAIRTARDARRRR